MWTALMALHSRLAWIWSADLGGGGEIRTQEAGLVVDADTGGRRGTPRPPAGGPGARCGAVATPEPRALRQRRPARAPGVEEPGEDVAGVAEHDLNVDVSGGLGDVIHVAGLAQVGAHLRWAIWVPSLNRSGAGSEMDAPAPAPAPAAAHERPRPPGSEAARQRAPAAPARRRPPLLSPPPPPPPHPPGGHTEEAPQYTSRSSLCAAVPL